eukprot:TRINITY_DN9486_c0_g1_i1.p1 TRINITY_DN9486_c0_g1~~TRINITY_DN9486_c0_g1_i1.p1  ORF type:complete len:352 (-),score=84.42 TRINITY_DN9486_c0_g1_i1:62-1117(-)
MPRVKKLMKGAAQRAEVQDENPISQAELEYEAYLKAERERKMREAALRARLKSQLEEYEHLSALNSAKVQDNWRRIMRNAKLEDLKRQIEIVSQSHERDMDAKDVQVWMLSKEVEQCDEQYAMLTRAHMQTVDQLIELQRERIQAIEQEYEMGVEHLRQEFGAEKVEIVATHTRHIKELTDLVAALNYQHLLGEQDAKAEFSVTRDELRNKNGDEYNSLRSLLEGTIEDLEHHFETAHSQYMRQNDQRQETFKMMMLKDEDATRTLQQQQDRIQLLQDSIHFWRMKLSLGQREHEQRNSALKVERDMVLRHFHELKAKLNAWRSQEHKRLIHLCTTSERTVKSLQKKLIQV